ncbi:MAG: indolepyruvate ferredoxin oxidoreductase subunit alpha [Anaerolineae bacterium]
MYRIDEARCSGCGDCVAACPAGAIALVDGRPRIDGAQCVECGSCADACPRGAIVMAAGSAAAAVALRPVQQAPVVSVPATDEALRPRSEVEVLPAEARRSRIWPLVGSALVWAARELLPEVVAALRASRGVALPATGRRSTALGAAAPARRRSGHRHRWGRA